MFSKFLSIILGPIERVFTKRYPFFCFFTRGLFGVFLSHIIMQNKYYAIWNEWASAGLGPARIGSAVLGSVELSLAQLGLALLCCAWLERTWLGSARLGWTRLRWAQLELARLRWNGLGFAKLG